MIAYAPHTLVIHHTAGLLGFDDIRKAHVAGDYDEVAYNAVIERDASLRWGRPLGTQPAANAGRNAGTAAVAVVGDNTVPGREWTLGQVAALARFVTALEILYPGLEVIGHKALKPTACPGLEVGELLP